MPGDDGGSPDCADGRTGHHAWLDRERGAASGAGAQQQHDDNNAAQDESSECSDYGLRPAQPSEEPAE